MVPPPINVCIGCKGKTAPMVTDVSFVTYVTLVELSQSMTQVNVISLSLNQLPLVKLFHPNGGGGLSGFSQAEVGPLLEGSDWRRDRSDWRLNPVLFDVFRRWTTDAYGMDILVDVYASKFNAQLPLYGVTALRQNLLQIQANGGIIYVNGDWADYNRALNFIRSLKVVALVVAPIWSQLQWFAEMVGAATHFWELQQEDDVFLPLSKGHTVGIGPAPWKVGVFICDFREKHSIPLARRVFPSLSECRDYEDKDISLPKYSKVFTTDIRPLMKPSPFNATFLEKASNGVVNSKIRDFVLKSIKEGFRSGYRGSAKIFRDYSKALNTSQLKF